MVRPRSLPKPDQEYILERIPELQTQFKEDLETLERIRSMRNLTWEVNIPQRLVEVTGATGLEYRDATIADELLTLPQMYLEQLPSLALTAAKETIATEGLTTRLEQFTTAALFEQCGRRATGPATINRVVDATFEGGGWSALVLDHDLWAEYSAARIDDYEDDPPGPKSRTKHQKYDAATETMKQRAGIPITWRHVDAATLLPIYEGDVLVAAIEIQRRSLSTCFRQYGLGFDGAGEICPSRTAVRDWSKAIDAGAEIEFIRFYDKDWMSYLVRYQGGYRGSASGYVGSAYAIPNYTRKHKYNLGRPPYYCSLGWTKNYEYARLATWSASEPKRNDVAILSFVLTVLAHMAVRDAIPPMITQLPVDAQPLIGDDGKPAGPQVYELGMNYFGLPGQTTAPVAFQANSRDLQQLAAQIDARVDSLSPAKKTGQLGNVGGEGFALSTIFEQSKNRYLPFESSILQHLTDVTTDFWKLVAGLDEDVYVACAAATDGAHIKVSKADFDVAMRQDWALHVDSTAARIILERYLSTRVKNGSLSEDQMIQRLGDNVDEVRSGRAKDRVRQTPAFQRAEEAEIWAAWGKGKEWQKSQRQAEQMATMGASATMGAQAATPATPMGGPGMPGNVGSQVASPNGAGMGPQGPFQGGSPPGMPASPQVQTSGSTAQVSQLGGPGG